MSTPEQTENAEERLKEQLELFLVKAEMEKNVLNAKIEYIKHAMQNKKILNLSYQQIATLIFTFK